MSEQSERMKAVIVEANYDVDGAMVTMQSVKILRSYLIQLQECFYQATCFYRCVVIFMDHVKAQAKILKISVATALHSVSNVL